MNKSNKQELANIKSRYEQATSMVSEASGSLAGLFKTKMLKIKKRVSMYFAECEIKLSESRVEVLEISKIVAQLQQKVITPTVKYEA